MKNNKKIDDDDHVKYVFINNYIQNYKHLKQIDKFDLRTYIHSSTTFLMDSDIPIPKERGSDGAWLHQRHLALVCKKYDKPLVEAYKLYCVNNDEKNVISFENEIKEWEKHLKEDIELLPNLPLEIEKINNLMKTIDLKSPEWFRLDMELKDLVNLPNHIKGSRMHLGKEKKRFQREKEQLEVLKAKPQESFVYDAWFRFGYYPDIWKGLEKFLPDGVEPRNPNWT